MATDTGMTHSAASAIRQMRLEARDISFKYGKGTRQILDHVNLTVEPGESVGIMAPSGYGKTTLCKILAGYERPDSGEVLVDGMPVLELRGYCPVQMVWQHPELSVNPKRRLSTVLEEGDWTFENPSERARIEAGLGIRDDWKDRFPVEVSGGELQRFCIARALGRRTELLIADEPTTALDVTIQAQVLEMMKGLRDKYNTSMLMITHDLGIVAEICDEVSVVYAGRVIEHGTLEDIFKNTRHPYTEGLFNSLPNLENRQAELKPIKGLMPDPSNLPKGCAFCPRCEYAMEICKTQKPPRTYRNDTHYVECHLYNKDNIHEGKVNIR